MDIIQQETQTIKPKRGRRSKKDILNSEKDKIIDKCEVIENNLDKHIDSNKDLNGGLNIEIEETNEIIDYNSELIEEEKNKDYSEDNVVLKQATKKRGRKPKGGKIIVQNIPINTQKENKQNVILHLKCSIKDLELNGNYNSNLVNTNIESFNFSYAKNELQYDIINNKDNNSIKIDSLNKEDNSQALNSQQIEYETGLCSGSVCCSSSSMNESEVCDKKEIWRKLKILEKSLHLNNISDKKSACFWCSYDFDNPPIHIPKHYIKDSYSVYGCFCTPECSVAYLMNENIDSSTKFERYGLINHIYSKIYDYKKNIKPAPNPHYMLDRFYGPLSIQEYRALLKSERLFLIVDKPMTRILPEFHEDNDDFIIHNKIIPSNNYQIKKNNKKPQTKTNIMNEKFGISSN
jgi:hypothetical protein